MPKLQRTMLLLMLLAVPASNTYKLDSYTFGSGGTEESASTLYKMEGIAGEQAGAEMGVGTLLSWSGLMPVQMISTPPAPTFTNVSNDYDKLQFILATASNPTDTQYAIAISDDNWVTTEYVQSDNTIGAVLGAEDWQTYAAWGGASGEYAIGLTSNTQYKIKVKARQGDYTEGPWGPEATASTTNLTLSFDLDVAATDTETAGPYLLDIGALSVGSVTTATDKIWVDIATNANYGAYVYVAGANQGLESSVASHTISAYSGDLTGQQEGFGLRVDALSETSGGPLIAVSPYNGTNDVVGGPAAALSEILTSSNAEIAAGRASLLVKSKISSLTPASTDYSETITLVATAVF